MDWIAGLDHWTTGQLDWITGLTFELKLCVSHDLTQSDVLNWVHVRCLAAIDCLCGMHATVGVLCLRDHERYAYTTADGELGRPIGTIIYSKASR